MTNISLQRPVGFWQQMASGLRKQSSVISALIIKDFKMRSGMGRLGLFWMIVDPMFMLVMLASLWYLIGRTEIDGVNVLMYLSSGLIIFGVIRQSMASVPQAIKSNTGLLNFPQVKPISCIIGRFIFEMFLLMVTSVFLYFLFWWFMGMAPAFSDPLRLFQVLGIALIFGMGISLLMGVYGTLYDTVKKVAQLLARPLMFLSCIIHSLRDLPAAAQHYILYNPIVHLVDTGRTALFDIPPFPGVNLYYPTIWAVSLLGIGILVYYVNRFKLIQA